MRAQSRYLAIGACSVLALVAVYMAVALGEFVAGEGRAASMLAPAALPPAAAALFIHAVVTMPAAFSVGYGLVRFVPGFGLNAVVIVVLLWTALVAVFQLAVYEPNVAALSALKVVCVAVPLLVGGLMGRRARAGIPHAPAR